MNSRNNPRVASGSTWTVRSRLTIESGVASGFAEHTPGVNETVRAADAIYSRF